LVIDRIMYGGAASVASKINYRVLYAANFIGFKQNFGHEKPDIKAHVLFSYTGWLFYHEASVVFIKKKSGRGYILVYKKECTEVYVIVNL